jgi:hypothetical protein
MTTNTISYDLDIDRTTLVLALYAVALAYVGWKAAERAEREAWLAKNSARRVNAEVQQLRNDLEDVDVQDDERSCSKWGADSDE